MVCAPLLFMACAMVYKLKLDLERDKIENKITEVLATLENPEEAHRLINEQNRLVDRINNLTVAARALRTAQKSYMANRGNQEAGKAVAVAAKELDRVLGDI